jgi:hypothetical protein
MIRDLHIVLDTGTEITFSRNEVFKSLAREPHCLVSTPSTSSCMDTFGERCLFGLKSAIYPLASYRPV